MELVYMCVRKYAWYKIKRICIYYIYARTDRQHNILLKSVIDH